MMLSRRFLNNFLLVLLFIAPITGAHSIITLLITCGSDQALRVGYTINTNREGFHLFTPPVPSPGGPSILWTHTYGGTNRDEAHSVVECLEGGFAIGGSTQSFANGVTDFWLVRTDEFGNLLWSQSYGGSGNDWGFSVVECREGGFAFTGFTWSYGAGSADVWLVRTDSEGNLLWDQTYGGPLWEGGFSIVECQDGGFAIAGKSEGNNLDVLLIRTDLDGNLLWSKMYGGADPEEGNSLAECIDGSFIIVGRRGEYESCDALVMRTDANGTKLWELTYGGEWEHYALSVVECEAGGFAVAGRGQLEEYGGEFPFLVRTNANGDVLWNTYYRGSGTATESVVECQLGGFALATWGGFVHTDANGTHLWSKTALGGGGKSLVQCENGDFAIAGFTSSSGAGMSDFWLARVPDPVIFWAETPTDQKVEFSARLSYALKAGSHVGIDQYWINDTIRFSINGTGVISNATVLPVWNYALNVVVNDSLDNRLAATFTIVVEESAPPNWRVPPTDQVRIFDQRFYYSLEASDLSGISHWEIDDISRFTITWRDSEFANSSYAFIQSLQHPLALGVYGLRVTVYDTLGNSLTESFTLTVMLLPLNLMIPWETMTPVLIVSLVIIAFGRTQKFEMVLNWRGTARGRLALLSGVAQVLPIFIVLRLAFLGTQPILWFWEPPAPYYFVRFYTSWYGWVVTAALVVLGVITQTTIMRRILRHLEPKFWRYQHYASAVALAIVVILAVCASALGNMGIAHLFMLEISFLVPGLWPSYFIIRRWEQKHQQTIIVSNFIFQATP